MARTNNMNNMNILFIVIIILGTLFLVMNVKETFRPMSIRDFKYLNKINYKHLCDKSLQYGKQMRYRGLVLAIVKNPSIRLKHIIEDLRLLVTSFKKNKYRKRSRIYNCAIQDLKWLQTKDETWIKKNYRRL